MKRKISGTLILLLVLSNMMGISNKSVTGKSQRYSFDNLLDIKYTPDAIKKCATWFTDQGAWFGFTIPQQDTWVNGFCGPFHLDNRYWMSSSLVTVGVSEITKNSKIEIFKPDSVAYFPGEVFMRSNAHGDTITQRMVFVNNTTVLLKCTSNEKTKFTFSNENIAANATCKVESGKCIFTFPKGESLVVTFAANVEIKQIGNNRYKAVANTPAKECFVTISMFNTKKELLAKINQPKAILGNPLVYMNNQNKIWDQYLKKILRTDMPKEYDRIAVKSVVTLMSNWKSSKGGILHDGIVPSHGVDYFMGFWGWDSWKHAAVLASFAPELAKNQVRAVFDHQLKNGMIIDVFFSDSTKNNSRDSKPPLAAWAVNEIYKQTLDTAFVREMYPRLLSYHRWWYADRDHNGNRICEFGSVDGTTEAAAWESGMDNAIRFDNATMVQNSPKAWSFNQESVDLNAFLAFEYKILKQLATVAGVQFNEPDYTSKVADYFFSTKKGFFFDRSLTDSSFIEVEGSEAYIPVFTGIASKEQVKQALVLLSDTNKFSTYIPFPSVAADNPKFMTDGYWRGPIWLDQTYFAISGLRNYGYEKLADKYTMQVFDRLEGLKGDMPIHETYSTRTGKCLRANNFSWSAVHLLMLYKEFGQ